MNEKSGGNGFETLIAIVFGVALIVGGAAFFVYKNGNVSHFKYFAEVIALSAGAPLVAAAGFGFGALVYGGKVKRRADLRESFGTLLGAFAISAMIALGVVGYAIFEGTIYSNKFLYGVYKYRWVVYTIEALIVVYTLFIIYRLIVMENAAEIKAEKIRFYPRMRKRDIQTERIEREDGSEYFAIVEEDEDSAWNPELIAEAEKAWKYPYRYLRKKVGEFENVENIDETKMGLLKLAELAGKYKLNVPLGFLYGYDAELAGAIESVYRGSAVRELGKELVIEYYTTKKGGNDGDK